MPTDWLTTTILEQADLEKITPNLSAIKIISRETCEKIQVLVYEQKNKQLKVLTTNNFSEQLKQILKMLEDRGFFYEIFYTSTEWFKYAMSWYDLLEKEEENKKTAQKAQLQAEWKWALSMIKQLFEKRWDMDPWKFIMEMVRLSFQSGASDLHFQPEEKWILMRLRIDWVLQEVVNFTHKDFLKYLQKLKFIAGTKMNIDYVPQDGRFSFEADVSGEMKKIDARVSFMPGIQSESTVIRFLDGTKWILTFEQLGFHGQTYEVLKKNLEKNVWMSLVTWPTWSWKTTTLYSILNYLNNGKEKIITLEDPVEYQVSWLQQSQINYAKNYDYELGLKAILRHDPDIVLVGETRTLETAEISINAALTWHLVFTTLHTNSAIESISRILSMGVKPYMLAPALNMIIAQRLVRKVCPHCSVKKDCDYAEKSEISSAIKKITDANPSMKLDFDEKIVTAVGCDKCNNTWYIGRIAILEVFDVNEDVKTMIIEWKSTIDIYGKARENGYLTLKEDWILKMLEWKTTLDELRRVL